MSDFYNKYPYTDFHELNLDWIIERVKQLTADWLETKQAWENTEADWQELYNYVHDYFDNLDVQDEINNKINAMIADGTFVTITTPVIEAKVASMMPGTVASQIGDTVASQIGATVASQIGATVADQIDAAVVSPVNSWLADHITQPTTPVVDNTLSISGAAADSKTVGDKCYMAGNLFISSGNVSTYNDMDTMPQNRMILISSGVATSAYISHLPVESQTIWSIYMLEDNGNNGIQMAWTRETDAFYYRNKHTILGWNPWQRIPMLGESVVSTNITVNTSNVSSYDDLDSYPINTFIGISSTVSTSSYIDHLPEQNTTLFVRTNSYNLSAMNGIQFVYTLSGHIYFRIRISSWSSWNILTTGKSEEFYAAGNLFISSGNVSTYNDMDTMPKNRMILISSSVATSANISHLPVESQTIWSIYMLEDTSSNGIQLAWTRETDAFYYRNKHTSLGWNEWNKISTVLDKVRYPIHTCIDKTLDFTNKGMYIFGDSVTTSSHGGFTWGSVVASKLNNTEYNYGVGGAYYYGGSNTIKAQIDGVSDWSSADIVFLCGGVNDCINHVGSSNFKSAVATAIDTVKTNAPGAIIIVVGPMYTEWQNKQYFNIENYAAALCNIALSKECNFINGFDIPIALETNTWVSEQVDNDGLHPNATGKKIYAQGIINALI